MSRKPENTFISGVHNKFPDKTTPYREKMANPYRGGTPDVFYSGDFSDLWAEYKFLERIPSRADVIPDLSPLQRDWLRERYNEGRNVSVIVGCPAGGVIYENLTWEQALSAQEFTKRIRTKQELAEWIWSKTMKAPWPSTKNKPRSKRLSKGFQ